MVDQQYYTSLDQPYRILAECSDNFDEYKRMLTIEGAKKLYSMNSFDCISALWHCHYDLDDFRTRVIYEDEYDNWEDVDKILTDIDRLQEDIIELATDFVIHAAIIRDDYCLINHSINLEISNQIRQLNSDCSKCREFVKNILFKIGF